MLKKISNKINKVPNGPTIVLISFCILGILLSLRSPSFGMVLVSFFLGNWIAKNK